MPKNFDFFDFKHNKIISILWRIDLKFDNFLYLFTMVFTKSEYITWPLDFFFGNFVSQYISENHHEIGFRYQLIIYFSNLHG